MIAMGLFGLGSLLGGLADSQSLLIIARGLQGLGGALLSPATLSLIMSNFEEGQERNRAMGICRYGWRRLIAWTSSRRIINELHRLGVDVLRECTDCRSCPYSCTYRPEGEQNIVPFTLF